MAPVPAKILLPGGLMDSFPAGMPGHPALARRFIFNIGGIGN
jgi:hypothetical protein